MRSDEATCDEWLIGSLIVKLIMLLSLVFSARCNMYISRLCHDASPSVRLSVTEVQALRELFTTLRYGYAITTIT